MFVLEEDGNTFGVATAEGKSLIKLGHLIETYPYINLENLPLPRFLCSEFDHISSDSQFQTDRFFVLCDCFFTIATMHTNIYESCPETASKHFLGNPFRIKVQQNMGPKENI